MELEKAGWTPLYVDLGKAKVKEVLSGKSKNEFDTELQKYGLGLLIIKKSYIIEKIKTIIITSIHNADTLSQKQDWHQIILSQLQEDYTHDRLSKFFSSVAGITLEHYIILQKIERVKELLFQNELSLKDISKKMGFASQPHLSYQFKRVTGITPLKFRAGRIRKIKTKKMRMKLSRE
ncbi:helix-turn-helix domain-containing protein [Pedobacter nutrimenti]|nr:helix-turn-helix transcriptional regulator [Pedobacter nutrimenti]